MNPAPILVVPQSEPHVILAAPEVERPAPSAEQERIADEIFSSEQSHAVAGFLGVQMGLVVVQHLLAETFRPAAEEETVREEGDDPKAE